MTKSPLLFVHGAWHGSWCWEEHFTGYFAEAGYEVHTVDLRGHGKGAGGARLEWHSVADYVDDVRAAVSQIGRPPVLIAHSMGGFVAQKYLETDPAAGAVLVGSVPPRGVLAAVGRLARLHPALLLRSLTTFNLYPLVKGPERTRELFYSAALQEDVVARYSEALGNESYRAFLDMVALSLPHPKKIRGKVPILVLGGADDRIFVPADVNATASAYGTTAQIFDGMAHNLMLEVGWEDVAGSIRDWLAG